MHKPKKWIKTHWETLLVVLLIAYFLYRAVYFAFSIDHSIPPDEVRHLARCQLFARSMWLPASSPDSAPAAMARYTPYLYYLLMGKILPLNASPMPDLLFLRLVSILFGVATVLYGWGWMRLFTADRLVRVLFVTMLTNTLMFTVMCSAVNYDSLTNLLAAATVYYFTRFLVGRDPSTLVAFLGCMLAGSLTKKAFLPLSLILMVCLVMHERRSLTALPGELLRYLVPIRWTRIAGVGVVGLLFSLNLTLYGVNLFRFGKLTPSPQQVMTQEKILQSGVMARNMIIDQYRKGELTLEQAVALARQIDHPADRRDTLGLLSGYEQKRRAGWQFNPMSRVRYVFAWSWLMLMRTYGMVGHRIVYQSEGFLALYTIVFLVATAMMTRHWRPRASEGVDSYMMAVTLFYAVVLMQFVNYQSYLKWEGMGMGFQGRYIFPVLVPLYGLVAKYLLAHWPPLPRIAGFFATSAVFIYGDFFFFLKYVQPAITR